MAIISTEWKPLEAGTRSSSGTRLNFYEQSLVGARRRRQRIAVLEYETAFQITLIQRLEDIIQAIEELPPGLSTLDVLFHIRVTIIAFAPRKPKPDRPEQLPPRELWNEKTVFPTWTSKLSEISKSIQETFFHRRPADRTVRSLNAELRRNVYVARSLIDMMELELVELREIQEIQDAQRKPFINLLERRNALHQERATAVERPVAGPEVNPDIIKKNPRLHGSQLDHRQDIPPPGQTLFEPSSDADESGNTDDSLSDDDFPPWDEIFDRGRRGPRLPLPARGRNASNEPAPRERDNSGPRRPTFHEALRAAEWEHERRLLGSPPKESNMNPKPGSPFAVQKRGALYYPTYCGHRFSLYAHVALTLAQVNDDCYDECQRIISDNRKLTDNTEAEEVILVEALGMIVNKRDDFVIQQFIHHATLLRHIRETSRDEIPQLFSKMPDLNSGIRRRFDINVTDTFEILRDIATRFNDELVSEFNDNAVPLTDQPWLEKGALIRRQLPMDLGFDIGIGADEDREGVEDMNHDDERQQDVEEQQGEGSHRRQEKDETAKNGEGSGGRDKDQGKETEDNGDGDEERDGEEDKGKAKVIEEDADDEKEDSSGDELDEGEDEEECEDVPIDYKGKGKAVDEIDHKGKGRAFVPVEYKGKGKGKAIDLPGDEDEGRDNEIKAADEEPAIAKIIGNVGELDIKGKGRAVVPSRPDEVPSAESGRASGNLTDRRPGRWAGQAVQIYPRLPGTVLQFPLPPEDSDDQETQWTRNFFESVPFELQDAVATGSLHRINRELSLYGVRDAIDYVSLLQEAGCIDFRETKLDIASVSKRRS